MSDRAEADFQDKTLHIAENQEMADRLGTRAHLRAIPFPSNGEGFPPDHLDQMRACERILVVQFGGESGRLFAEKALPVIEGLDLGPPCEIWDIDPEAEAAAAEAETRAWAEAEAGVDASTNKTAEVRTAAAMAAVQLSTIDYDLQRKQIAKSLGIRVTTLDELRKEEQKKLDSAADDEVVENIEPWPEPVDGDLLVEGILEQIHQHIVLPDGAAEPIAFWCLLTYCYDQFRILPILGIVSPQKRCGKTTLLEVISGLSCRSLLASNISSAAAYRTIEKYHPTLLVDEADSFLKDNEELRGVLNSGHTRASAFVIRCDGDDNDPKKFSTWAPKSVAAIGKLPRTISDRSIMISLKRKSTKERRKKIDFSFDSQAKHIRRRCLRWANDNGEELFKNRFTISVPGNDRAEDNWEPIAAIAGVIGNGWLDRLNKSAHLMLNLPDDRDDLSILLLRDIRAAFQSTGEDRFFSENLKNFLNGLEERPWQDWKGKGLTTNVVALFLEPFGIKSKNIRRGPEVRKGYLRDMFEDAFNRYIPAGWGFQTATPLQHNETNELHEKKPATSEPVLPSKNSPNTLKTKDCSGVAVQRVGTGRTYTKNDEEVIL